MTKQYSGYCAKYNRLTNEYIKAINAQDTARLRKAIAAIEKHKRSCKICKGEK